MHDSSFRLCDYHSKLILQLYDWKYSSSRTEQKQAVDTHNNVIVTLVTVKVQNELNSVSFLTVSADASNTLDLKLVPALECSFHSLVLQQD